MRPDTASVHRERIIAALVYIESHLDDALSMSVLARRSGLSLYHFQRVFRRVVGESPHRYVQRLRLERAAFRLKRTQQSVTELALASGYRAHEAFTRAFRTEFGQSPHGFRNQDAWSPTQVEARARIVTRAPQRIAFVRSVGPYEEWHRAFHVLRSWAREHGLFARGTVLGIPWDHKKVTAPDRIRYDAALTIDDGITGSGDVGVRSLRGGDYLWVRHQGPYRALDDTYDFIYGQAVAAMGRQHADAPPFEVYVDNPAVTPAESLRTDVYVPLVPRVTTRD